MGVAEERPALGSEVSAGFAHLRHRIGSRRVGLPGIRHDFARCRRAGCRYCQQERCEVEIGEARLLAPQQLRDRLAFFRGRGVRAGPPQPLGRNLMQAPAVALRLGQGGEIDELVVAEPELRGGKEVAEVDHRPPGAVPGRSDLDDAVLRPADPEPGLM